MRHLTSSLPALVLSAAAALAALVVAAPSGAADRPGQSLSIERCQGTMQIRGRGYVNIRVAPGALTFVDQSPSDGFSPTVGGVPRGKLFATSGREITAILLGGRYRVSMRGFVSISARGDGLVQLMPDPGSTCDVRVGDVPRPVSPGEPVRIGFGGVLDGSSAASAPAPSGDTRDGNRN
ncbi:MAG: hypothetical protein FJW96_02155 [Actinobacteria bacterium]|nr:hypothetical protein [Actinomycetota bacterium]